MSDKEKAMKEPYANDFGPQELDAKTLESYPKEFTAGLKESKAAKEEGKQELPAVSGGYGGYSLLLFRCARCHPSSRPLNSQFIETEGKTPAERAAHLDQLKKEHPELFKPESKYDFQVESNIWERYVKRMMAKPGCDIPRPDGKKIWQFLVYDSNHRKLKDPAAWKDHRENLLKDFKESHPDRYKELYKQEAPKPKSKSK